MTSTGHQAAHLHLPRRLFHIVAASFFPLLALFVERNLLLALLLASTTLFVICDIARLYWTSLGMLFHRLFGPLLREREGNRITGASYMLLGTLAVFTLFPRDVAILAVLFIALGDPVAAIVGIRSPGPRVFGKSPLGTAAMIATCLSMAGVLHWAGAISLGWPVAVGAVVAGLTELLPLPLDDNLWVPLAAGMAMVLLGM